MDEVLSSTNQRDHVLAAAIAVLARGAEHLTVRNVATEASCSTTGVYTYFGSKDGLVDAMFRHSARSFGAALTAAGPDLLARGRAYRSWALANPAHYRLIFGGAVPGFIPSEESLAVAAEAFAGLVAAVGDHHRAVHLWATVHGYVSLELAGMAAPETDDHDEGAAAAAAAAYERGLAAIMEWLALFD